MRRIGLLGGIGWGATADYYRRINLGVKRRLDGHHSAEMLIRSFDLHPLLERADDVAGIEGIFERAARDLCAAGAEVLAIASLTGHRYARPIAQLPAQFIDIIETAGSTIRSTGYRRVAVWATSFALGDAALLRRLSAACDVQLLPPPPHTRPGLDEIVFTELADQTVSPPSLDILRALLRRQIQEGAEALLLATTDFSFVGPLLDSQLPVLDITEMHCAALVGAACGTKGPRAS